MHNVHIDKSFHGELYRTLLENPVKLDKNDYLVNKLLISNRGYPHLLYDEAMKLIHQIVKDFSHIVAYDSVGKSYDQRDIPLIKIDATKFFE